MITIAVISGQEYDRKSIIRILAKQNDFHIVTAGADGYDALMSAKTQQPDVIIMDFSMDEIICSDLAPIIKRNSPSTAIIVLCSLEEQAVVSKAFNAGISGCLLKQGGFDNLASSIWCVYHGGLYFSQPIRNHAVQIFLETKTSRAMGDAAFNGLFSFTDLRIFFGILHGHTDNEIAKELNMNTGSVRNCITRIKQRTRLRNRTQMAILALSTAMMNNRSIKGQLANVS